MKRILTWFFLVAISTTLFAEKYNYSKQFGKYTVKINGENTPFEIGGKLNVTVTSGNNTFDTFIEIDDAWVEKMKVTDLDQDGLLEVLVVTSSGNGGYGDISFLEFDGQSFKNYKLPGFMTFHVDGYRGYDTFLVKNNKLVRSFPLYNGEIFNVQTGTFYIYYTFTCNNEWAITGIKHVKQNDSY